MPAPPNPNDPKTSGPQLQPIPEMVGATSAPLYLVETTTHVSLAIHVPTGPALLRADLMPRRVFLNIENITSKVEAPSYEVYLNLPPGAEPEKHPDLRVGSLAMFGLLESSRSSEQHPGNGLTYTLEVTNLFLRLAATQGWDAKNLRVSFVPEPWPGAANVQVGRVSLYFE